jgi:DNA-binding PadR family transcriptional regulator
MRRVSPESDASPKAKYYRLTRAGRKQLEREATRWNAIADAIAAVLREA